VLRQDIRFFILIEPGLGYIIPILQRKCPQARIIALHVRQEAVQAPVMPLTTGKPPVAWSPETGVPLQQFLEQEIPDIEAAAIQVIEWRPALAVYGEGYRGLLVETVDFIKRIDANTRTICAFGSRWFSNFFKNLGILRRVYTAPAGCLGSQPLIVTGAGPSLEETIPQIRELRKKGPLPVLAASSSVPALMTRGIVPEFVITSDGGGWALFHLYASLRHGNPSWGLAASLIAALPSQCAHLPMLVISDGSLWQNLVLQGLHIPSINLTQRGTVTAQALDLAFVLTQGPIYITGMDLANRDIRTHARPYSFERFLEEKATRLNPVYTQGFVRSRAIEAGGSHTIYATWFSRQRKAYPRTVYSLGTNNPVFQDSARNPQVFGLDPSVETEAITRRGMIRESFHAPDNPIKAGVDMLIAALAAPQTAARINRELAPLLFPHRAEHPGSTEMQDKILALLEPYYRSRHG
jgi:hypothetical protein